MNLKTYACVLGCKKCSFFQKIWRALFPWNTCFEIRPFALLSMNETRIYAHFRRGILLRRMYFLSLFSLVLVSEGLFCTTIACTFHMPHSLDHITSSLSKRLKFIWASDTFSVLHKNPRDNYLCKVNSGNNQTMHEISQS